MEVRGVVLVRRLHRRIEAVAHDVNWQAEDRRSELHRRKIAFHLLEPSLAEDLDVHQRGIAAEESGGAAQLHQQFLHLAQLLPQVGGRLHGEAVAQVPLLGEQGTDAGEGFGVAVLFIGQEPGALLGDRHIRGNQHAVVERQVSELRNLATVCREGFGFELLEVNVFGFVNIQVVKRLGVGRAFSVLRDNLPDGSRVKGNDVVVVFGLEERVGPAELPRRFLPHDPMHPALVAPVFPVLEHRGQCVRQAPFGVGHDKGSRGARHELEILQLHGGMEQTFARAAPRADKRLVRAVKRRLPLHLVHVDFGHQSLLFESCSVLCGIVAVFLR